MATITSTTSSNEINWLIEKAQPYFSDEFDTVYQFKGNVPFRMLRAARDFLRGQGAENVTGRSATSLGVKLIEMIDVENRRYYKESVNLSFGTTKGTECSVTFQVTISDYTLTEEDLAAI